MVFDYQETKSILKKIPTVFMLYETSTFTVVQTGQVYILDYGIRLGQKTDPKNHEFPKIVYEDTTRFLDGLILQAINLGYVYDNENNPLTDLLSVNIKSQLEVSKLHKIEKEHPHQSIRKPIL